MALAVATGVGGAAVNVFARHAPWRRYPWYLAGLVPGIGGSELGASLAAVHLAAGGLAAGLGATRSRVGMAGLAAAAGAAAGLVGLQRDAAAATTVLERALAAAVGPGQAGLGRPPGPLPVGAGRSGLVVERGLAYGDEFPERRLDVWRRPDVPSDGRAPVLVYVHGGSWTGGSRVNQGAHLIGHLAARGWVCVSVDYRLGPRNRWPAPIVDVKRAIAWVREHAAGHGGDPGFVAVAGGSAGGHLAALAAVSGNDPAFQPGFEGADTAVQAAAVLYGVLDLTALNDDGRPHLRDHVRRVLFDADLDDDPETWRAASPTWRLGPDTPPTFVVHGDRDEVVSVNQSRAFARRARAVSAGPFGYAELPYAHHSFDMVGSARTVATVRAIGRFLDVVHDRHVEAGPGGR